MITFRWFGPRDPIPLTYIRQIPAVRGIVSALFDIPVGEPWPLEALGVAPIDGKPPAAERDSRKIWQTFADHWHLFRATPTQAWLAFLLSIQLSIDPDIIQHPEG